MTERDWLIVACVSFGFFIGRFINDWLDRR
jgi:hypothetical protein